MSGKTVVLTGAFIFGVCVTTIFLYTPEATAEGCTAYHPLRQTGVERA